LPHLELYERGITLFNRAAFFEAHEVLEDVWRSAVPAEKKFLQGLIQVAVAFHHHSRGNLAGAQSLLLRASKNLGGYPDRYSGIELSSLRESVTEWHQALCENKPVPPLPRLLADFD
jgi:predicted metal-dependent hydrolase